MPSTDRAPERLQSDRDFNRESIGNSFMQFHLNGFQPGDPALSADQSSRKAGAEMPDHTDVLIVGSGPAGLTLAAQLAQYPDISTILIERKTNR